MPEKILKLLTALVLTIIIVFPATQFYKHKFIPAAQKLSSSCKRCNVVIIDIDVLRWDAIDCKARYNLTPNLCGFMSDSVKFTSNISHADLTFPSYISAMTSTYPISHDVWNELYSLDNEKLLTITDILKKENYSTTILGHVLGNRQLSYKDFENIVDLHWASMKDFRPHEQLSVLQSLGKPFFLYLYIDYLHFPYLLYDETVSNIFGVERPEGVAKTYEEFDDKLKNYIEENYKDVFTSYALANNKELFSGNLKNKKEEIYRFFTDSTLNSNADKLNLKDTWKPTVATYLKDLDFSNPKDILYLKGNYLALLAKVDQKLGIFLQEFKDRKLSGNTIVVLRSDHGEEFYEHGRITHGNNLYQELIHTPLVIKGPGVKPSEVEGLTEDIDIMPTILDILGVEIPNQVQGKSLVPMLSNPEETVKNYQIAQKGGTDYIASFRKGDWKLIMKEGNPYELYNLKDDPGEKVNLINTYPEKAVQFLRQYQNIIRPLPRYRESALPLPTWVDEQKRQRLKDEGYF